MIVENRDRNTTAAVERGGPGQLFRDGQVQHGWPLGTRGSWQLEF